MQGSGVWSLELNWRTGRLVSVVKGAVLILAFSSKGLLSQQDSDYTLTVPSSVSVQQGLCVHIPCQFTYPASEAGATGTFHGYWYKKAGASVHENKILTATNDEKGQIPADIKNRFQLTGEPEKGNCSFSINHAWTEDTGNYYFRLETGGGLYYSYIGPGAILVITVAELTAKPVILNSSSPASGKATTFTCLAPGTCSGTRPLINWMTDLQHQVSPWNVQHSNGSWTYGSNITFTPSRADQGKVLTCNVKYFVAPTATKTTENRLHLDIDYPPQNPEITVTVNNISVLKERQNGLVSVVVREGDNVSLLCKAESRPDPILSWSRKNETVSSTTKKGPGSPYLLPDIRSKNAGKYQCKVENPYGAAKKEISVNVQYPPKTVTFSVSQAYKRDLVLPLTQDFGRQVASGSTVLAQEGDSLHLFCLADSNPPTNIEWVKGCRTSGKCCLSPDNWLQLTSVRVEDAGDYACQAKNTIGSALGMIQLQVVYAPRFVSSQRSAPCWREGNSLLCNCSLHSWPAPLVKWLVKGETLSGNNSKGALAVTSYRQGKTTTSCLNWTGNSDREHNIICHGTNPVGVYTRQFLLSTLGTESQMVLIPGVCGALLAAGLFLLCLGLIKFYKWRQAKLGTTEAVDRGNGENQRANDASLIYSNILPVGQRKPYVGQAKAAGQGNPVPIHNYRVPSLKVAEPEELHYASLEFSKLKAREAFAPLEESVEYSEIRPK